MLGRREEEEEIEVEQVSDLVIFAIDARKSMYEMNEKGERHITNCLRVAQHVMKLRIVAQDNSKFGIILMGAQASEEEGEEGDDLLLLQPLATPSASSIEAIGKVITSIESHPRGRENEIKYYEKCVDLDKEECLDLHRILFFISTKFSALSDKNLSNRNKMLKQRYAKHVWLFTNDSDPVSYRALPQNSTEASLEALNASSRSSAMSTAQQLQDGNEVNMMLWAIEPSSHVNIFREDIFFMAFLKKQDEDLEEVYNRIITCHGQGFDMSAENVKNKFYKKHAIWNGRLDIGLGLMQHAIGVSCFRTLKIATTPAKKRLHAQTLEPVETNTRFIDTDTGAVVPEEETTRVIGSSGMPEGLEISKGEFDYLKASEVTRSLDAFTQVMTMSCGTGLDSQAAKEGGELAGDPRGSSSTDTVHGHLTADTASSHPAAHSQLTSMTDPFEDVHSYSNEPHGMVYQPHSAAVPQVDRARNASDAVHSSSTFGSQSIHQNGAKDGSDSKDDKGGSKEYMNVQVLYYITRSYYETFPHLRLEEPLFLTANDSEVQGSRTIFTALLHQLHTQEKVGIVKYNYKPQLRKPIPRLAVLVPQMQVLNAEGSVATPAGFNLVLLPFRAEIRVSPQPVPISVKEALEANPDYIESAKKMITAMTLNTTQGSKESPSRMNSSVSPDGKQEGTMEDSQKTVQTDSDDDDFLGGTFHGPGRGGYGNGNGNGNGNIPNAVYDYQSIHNPYLQSFYSRLEATALKSSKVSWDASLHDTLQNDPIWISNAHIVHAVKNFKDITGISDDAHLTMAKRKASSSTSDASAVKKAKKEVSIEDAKYLLELAHEEKVTVPALKDICGELGIPKGGKKADILDRIHFEVQKILNRP